MRKQKKARKDEELVYLNTTISKDDKLKLDNVSYITEEREKKPNSEKLIHWLLNYSKRDEILMLMKQEDMHRQRIDMEKKMESMKIKG